MRETAPVSGRDAIEAPDYFEPVVGWRAWFVVRVAGAPRLCSACYWSVWEPGVKTIASCRTHAAPDERCTCGIYASVSARAAAPFLMTASRAKEHAVGRVIGRVALWGKVVECERGWRAACAYPARIYVPAGPHESSGAGRGFRGWWTPRHVPLPADEIASALGEYGVPVEFVASASVAQLAELLDSRSGIAV